MRRILVTGANKGIGLAIAKAILEEHPDTFLYLGSRDLARGEAAAAELGHRERDLVLALDVASDASVSAAATRVREHAKGEALYGVVNNAGIGHGSGASLAELVQTNTLGVRRVCEAFLPLLDPTHGRVVNVTSASGPTYVAQCDDAARRLLVDREITWPRLSAFIEDGIARNVAAGNDAYGFSKACANAYTLLLAREHPNLRINACTPGFIETDMTRHYAASQGKSGAEVGMKPPAAGARAPLHLLFGELEGNGRYYGSDAQRSPLDRYRAPGSAPYTGD